MAAGWSAAVAPTIWDERATAASHIERAEQCQLLRDIFGNPFHPLAPIDPSLLTPAIVALAGDIYQQRAFERLPELATALVAGGCRDAELVEHLRGPGPHVRGCWALDLVLGKQ